MGGAFSGITKALGSVASGGISDILSGVLGGKGGGSGPGAPPQVPIAPTLDNSAQLVDEAAIEQAKKAQRGRASTLLTGGYGVTSNAPTAAGQLLGSA